MTGWCGDVILPIGHAAHKPKKLGQTHKHKGSKSEILRPIGFWVTNWQEVTKLSKKEKHRLNTRCFSF